MKIARVWAMPNKWTFKIPPIRALLERYGFGEGWIDPFAGNMSWAEYRNDLNPDNTNATYHMEALDFLNMKEWTIRGAVFDPPYSLTKISRIYKDIGLKFKGKENPTGGFPKVRKRIAELLPIGAPCISFGWNTCGIGKKNNMQISEILIVCHGGNRSDTLVTVEKKLRSETKKG